MGDNLNAVLESFGRPKRPGEKTYDGLHIYYDATNFSFTKDEVLISFKTDDSKVKTKRGISVGARAEEVIQAYGKPNHISHDWNTQPLNYNEYLKNPNDQYHFEYEFHADVPSKNHCSLVFMIKKGKVHAIVGSNSYSDF